MGNIFAGSEVVALGIQIEKNGRDFYNRLAEQSKVLKAKEVFRFLAGEEEKHIKVFQGILDKTQEFKPQGQDADAYYAYMSALAREHIFTQKDEGEKIAKAVKTDKEAIEKAIRFEEDSVVFYEGLKKIVPDYDVKIIETLIVQEEGHLKQLIETKKLL
ncbi:MAG: ferritin family protein [Candidatus Omnitrophica bacterium]|nr:ferritin family protein [Candidatus Omnitrophota bacterium]MDD5027547.1 ferritin family protein [Candidatus Omnitrophota bacterium]MDD5661776.1 ferritin family protein [Candidatus Omnitrophota bacterium]